MKYLQKLNLNATILLMLFQISVYSFNRGYCGLKMWSVCGTLNRVHFVFAKWSL